MDIKSGGILPFKFIDNKLYVMLVHPGGPFWAKKDECVWSIAKGLYEENEKPLEAAKREFKEETGFDAGGEFIELGQIIQPSKKIVRIWALEKDYDVTRLKSNEFSMEWPRGSGMVKMFPEVDRGQWFEIGEARKKILKGQMGFLDRLIEKINYTI